MEDLILLGRPKVFKQTLIVDLDGKPLVTIDLPILGDMLKEPPGWSGSESVN